MRRPEAGRARAQEFLGEETMARMRVTPRLYTDKVPGADWLSIDVGLWPEDRRPHQDHLTVMVYFQCDKWLPPAGPLSAWQAVATEIDRLWRIYSCQHTDPASCATCQGTDWKDYALWKTNGGRVDGGNYPVL